MKPAYLITGNEFLVAETLDRLRAEIGADPLSEVAFESGVAAAELATALETPSLLGGVRTVLVRDASSLTAAEVAVIERFLEAPPSDTILVLIAGGRTKLDAAVRKVGAIVAVDAPKGRSLVAWIRQGAGPRGLKVDDRAAWALIDAVGAELRDLDAALSQLAIAVGSGRVSAADIGRIFPRHADERIYKFTDGIGDRRLPVAMEALRRLLDQGEEPLVVFGALAGQIRRMLRAHAHLDGGARAVGDALNLPSWRAERLARQARSFSEAELVIALGTLAATDVEMKGGDIPPEAALERAVVGIVGHEGGR